VWLKHLTLLRAHGMASLPRVVAELGPGDSLGVGMAALLSGAQQYTALDVVPYVENSANLALFENLVDLFRARAGRPALGWPDYDQHLDERLFPGRILTDEILDASLAPERLDRIRQALAHLGPSSPDGMIRYIAPWHESRVITPHSLDLIVSHSVLEHVNDVPGTYRAMCAWLRPGGWLSHQIDLSAHGLTREWNGFRAVPEPVWKMLAGRRSFLINREPASVHLAQIAAGGCDIVCAMRHVPAAGGIARAQLSSTWRGISDDDLACDGVFVQAIKQA
jgi:hypothetical protein